MNTIRVRTHLDSETINLPQLRPFIGKDVEIVVVEEDQDASSVSAAGRLQELAAKQGVVPIRDYRDLLGGWPATEVDDGFEADLDRRRKNELVSDVEL